MRHPWIIVATVAPVVGVYAPAFVEAQQVDARSAASVLAVARPRPPVEPFLAVDSTPATHRFAWPTSRRPSGDSGGDDTAINAFLGAVVGAAAGIVACTAISNAINEGAGFSTCTTTGYMIFGAGGAALGLIVGVAVS